nr:LLM class flavin-dependent oxidoreductase [Bradyrhizobium uaiense]
MAIRFGYWMPLGSGGFVISGVPQRTDWTLDYNASLAREAEDLGFEYGLAPARFIASHGWELQQEAIPCTAVLSAQTTRLKLISAIHAGFWHPAMIAKVGSTIDVYSKGRFAINILTGWFKDEFRAFGEPWPEHDERYRRSEADAQGALDAAPFHVQGRLLQHQRCLVETAADLAGAPGDLPGGNSKAARRMAAKYSDWYFSTAPR